MFKITRKLGGSKLGLITWLSQLVETLTAFKNNGVVKSGAGAYMEEWETWTGICPFRLKHSP